MEDINGKKQVNAEQDFNSLSVEEQNKRLKAGFENLMQRCNQLEKTWMLARMNFLNEVVKCPEYNKEFRDKCAAEMESFLYPKEEQKL